MVLLEQMSPPYREIPKLKSCASPLILSTVQRLAEQGRVWNKLERLRVTLERFSNKYRVRNARTMHTPWDEVALRHRPLDLCLNGSDSEDSFMSDEFMSDELRLIVEQLSSERANALSLRSLYLFGKLLPSDPSRRLASARFLHRELPVRFCHRARELMNMPNGLSNQTGFRLVSMLYATYAHELLMTPKPTNASEEYEYTCLLAQLMMYNRVIPELFSLGLDGVRPLSSSSSSRSAGSTFRNGGGLQNVQANLNRFFLGRVGLWFLVEHHVSSIVPQPGFSGVIQMNACPVTLAHDAISDVEHICRHQLGCFPKMSVMSDSSFSFTYVPAHIRYMLVIIVPADIILLMPHLTTEKPGELLKNSARAVIEKHHPVYVQNQQILGPVEGWTAEDTVRVEKECQILAHHDIAPRPCFFPTIEVIVANGDEDVTFKVSDQGGGVKRSQIGHYYNFFSSSCKLGSRGLSGIRTPTHGDHMQSKGLDQADDNVHYHQQSLAGSGLGLPVSRLYASYFGGSLNSKSMEGFGMDSYLHLNKLGHKCENLPYGVQMSPAGRDSTPDDS